MTAIPPNLKIGIDFDNTIICYDKVFNLAGMEMGLIPPSLPFGKSHVRNYLRKTGNESEWIKLQGYVYGKKLLHAFPYPGAKSFFAFCKQNQIECCIISHKTRYPYSGPHYDLHQSARDWLAKENLEKNVYFELTKEDKIARIAQQGCTHFIDDLPEFLSLPGFPENLTKILFIPPGTDTVGIEDPSVTIAQSWKEIQAMLKTMLQSRKEGEEQAQRSPNA